MEDKKIILDYKSVCAEELQEEDKRLRSVAVEAAKDAYAPYSHFFVGAAVLLEDGTIVKGNNQENAAYPSGLCAERVALFSAGAIFPTIPVVALAITAMKDGEIQQSISPCGACRQVMLETEQRYGRPLRVLLCGNDETIMVSSAKDLLPLCFGKNSL